MFRLPSFQVILTQVGWLSRGVHPGTRDRRNSEYEEIICDPGFRSRKDEKACRSTKTLVVQRPGSLVGVLPAVLLFVSNRCLVVWWQGVVGSIPWSAMVFYTLWLELLGYSHHAAAGLVAGFSVGSCLGGLFGGYLGDFLAKRSPDKGERSKWHNCSRSTSSDL